MTTFAIPTDYQGIFYLVLTFVDGLLFGLAIKKGILAFIIFLVAAFLATYIGLSLPSISITTLFSRAISFLTYATARAPAIMVGLPILFFVGLAVGLWKG